MEGGAEELQPGGGGGGIDDITAMVHSMPNVLLVTSDAADGCCSKQCCKEVLIESK